MFLDNLRARIYNEVKAHTTVPHGAVIPSTEPSDPRFCAVFLFRRKQDRLFGRINSTQDPPRPPPDAHSCSLRLIRTRGQGFGSVSDHVRTHRQDRATLPRIWRADKPTAAPGGILSGREVRIVLRLSDARQDASNAPYRSGTRIGVRLRRAASGRASRGRAPPCVVRTRRHDLGTATRHLASRVGSRATPCVRLGSSVGANAPHAIISS